MTLKDVIRTLTAEVHSADKGWEWTVPGKIVISDLMSDVLTIEDEGFLLLTSLTTDQVARTGDIVGACAVVITNGKKPQGSLVELAAELGIPLMSTPLRNYDAAVALCRLREGL